MTTTTSSPAVTDTGRPARTALVVLAVGQAVASGLVSAFGGAFTTADRTGEPLIVPPGAFFSFWSVIIAVTVAYAIWAWPARRPDAELRTRLAAPLLVVTAGFSAWLVAAELEPIWSTLVVFVGLVAGLLWALRTALAERDRIARWSLLGRALLWGTIGLYLGWTSIAIWLNVATALAGSGAPLTGTAGTLGQLAVLAGATATAAALVRVTRGLLPYAAASGWALLGAALGSYAAGAPVLSIASAVGLGVVVVATVAEQLRRRRAR